MGMKLNKPFYDYVMSYRNKHHFLDESAEFANLVHEDLQFPKQTSDFHTITDYLEMNPEYSIFIDVFDKIWAKYTEECGHN